MAKKLRYFASTDALGFPIPSTLRGYKTDPCKCDLVEIKVQDLEEGVEPSVRYHPNGLHFFFQVKGNCCEVVPNSLIAATKRPKGKYREFLTVNGYSFVKTETFFKDNCPEGEVDLVGTPYSKTYTAETNEDLQSVIAADEAAFETAGQQQANTQGECTPE